MTGWRVRQATLVGLLLSALAGCASAASTPVASPLPASPDPLACGMVVAPGTVYLGGEMLIWRTATDPEECPTLGPGSTQTLEMRALVQGLMVEESVTVQIGADGAFEARMTVPTGIRLGIAKVTAIPPAELDCSEAAAAAGTPDACILPSAALTVEINPADLEQVRISSTDVATPTLPADADFRESYALAGPGPDEVTLVIFGSSCETRPATFVRTAPADSLQIVSTEIMPAGMGCDALAKPWTTVITVPEGFGDYRTVTVDNVEAFLLG